ncbi:hypothetical protein [Arthrobacter mangrovi]|uniref:Uncharacterized protein n=1 Tax=Arthrobacter mangrovi TaxID=2966350 RepID=A0ABQ5MP30_9MICC|nr:hypothetical protein [Arthrobacter mangrovi]GLB65754.1 hypothetical protein AHIS1636_01930 [Arthrobacter mangrovi]
MRDFQYSATAKTNSKHPYDWGRAMALAVARLTAQAEGEGLGRRRDLYDEDLTLRISELADGMQITLSWTPGAEEETAAPAHRVREAASVIREAMPGASSVGAKSVAEEAFRAAPAS